MKKYVLSGIAVLALMMTGCPPEPGVTQPAGGVKDITSQANSGTDKSTTKAENSSKTEPQESATVID